MTVGLMSFRVFVCGLSDVGCVRERNEDVWDQIAGEPFFVLADGMGGHRAGDVAAREAVRKMLLIMTPQLQGSSDDPLTCQDIARMMRLAMEQVNRHVYTLGKADANYRGMGTTLCALYVHPEGIVYGHVGDSRVYRYRASELKQLTDDHSLLRDLIRLGKIKDQPRETYEHKNIITRAIGTHPIVEPTVAIDRNLQNGDLILLCSDGLSDMVSSNEMSEIFSRPGQTVHQYAAALVAAAKAHGGVDNITLVLIKIQTGNASPSLS